MSSVDLALYGLIVTSGVMSFVSYILLGTSRFASAKRLGVWLIVFGLSLFVPFGRHEWRLALFGQRAEGVVERMTARRKTLHPVVRFVTADGQDVVFRNRQGVSVNAYAVGQSVAVYYLASEPTLAVVAARQTLWQPLAIGTVVSLVPLVGGGAIVGLRRRG